MRRSTEHTYKRMLKGLGDPEQLSIRKRFCLQWFKWGVSCKKDDKYLFVELAKRFRKEECRAGSTRTKLEKIARKYFQQVRKHKALAPTRAAAKEFGEKCAREGIGFCSDPAQGKKHVKYLNPPHRRHWILRHVETGEVIHSHNMRQTCRERGWTTFQVYNAQRDKRPLENWWIEKYNPEWDV
jgi:hypothetical protein